MTQGKSEGSMHWRREAIGALTITFLSIPQGLAYALIAGLPPAAGLYAATLPAIVGSLTRSSRFVVSGPTNALSLLVGGATATFAATMGATPMEVALTLAAMIGVIQVAAGVLKLGALVDYISVPVVLGYITGAAVLIGVGQLNNLTGTPMERGNLGVQIWSWVQGLDAVSLPTLCLGLGTTALVILMRLLDRRIPSAIVAVSVVTAVSIILDLPSQGVMVVAGVAPVPAGLPPITAPRLDLVALLWPVAVAGTVLSLVESTSVARTIASHTGDSLSASREFVGQGLSNLSAAFVGGYPVSGSLSRSTLNWRSGAQTRWSGALSGVLVVVVVLLASTVVDRVPLASLAGLLLVIAHDLIDRKRIRLTLRSGMSDGLAFLGTMMGTWLFSLDTAIYLGVGISIILFLRQARLLGVRELVADTDGRLRERQGDEAVGRCPFIRVLHVEGALFFGAAGELQAALDAATRDRSARVFVVRIKRTQGLDMTTVEVLASTAERLRKEDRHLLLVGMRPDAMAQLERTGGRGRIGADHLFPTEPGWFHAMEHALHQAFVHTGDHSDHAPCPLRMHQGAGAAAGED